MKSYIQFITEAAKVVGHMRVWTPPAPPEGAVSSSDLVKLERELDALFEKINIDIGKFGQHFKERVNDDRNDKAGGPITIPELKAIFVKIFNQKKDQVSRIKEGDEKVMNDILSNLNIPFVMKFDTREGEMSIVSKTIMKKKDFKSPDEKIVVR